MEHAARFTLRLAVVMTLLCVPASPLLAQAGRLAITAIDPDGNPVEGVTIVMTTPERNNLRLERTTNKKGKATIAVQNAIFLYDTVITKEGFTPITTRIKVALGGTTFREITLSPQDSRGAEVARGDGELVFTPAEAAFNEGVAALQARDLATAEAKFLEALGLDDSMAAIHGALAAVYSQIGDYEKSIVSAERVLELDPDNSRALRQLYDAHTKLGNGRDAKRALSALSALGNDSDAAALLFNEGAEALRTGDLAGAESRFLEALDVDPELASALDGLALVYQRQERWQEALAVAERLLDLQPDHVRGLRTRYDALAVLGDPRAGEALRALAQHSPDRLAAAFLDAGLRRFDEGDIVGAIVELEKALTIDPDAADAHYHLGLCHVNSGNSGKAKIHLQRVVELAPDSPNAEAAKEMLQYLE